MHPKLYSTIRILAGLILLIVGLDKYFGVYPLPTGTPEADAFVAALDATGYMMPLAATVATATGMLLLANRYVALAAVLAMPFSLNALLFHIFLGPDAMVPTVLLFLCNTALLIGERERYRELFKA